MSRNKEYKKLEKNMRIVGINIGLSINRQERIIRTRKRDGTRSMIEMKR